MKNVLVVDDTKNIRILLSKCLELEGYKVVTANDGQQALELFKRESFDLAFLDIKMPQFSGTEVLKRIREMEIKTPVIIITAYATIKNAVECTHMGAVAYLQKPFTAEKVRTILNEFTNLHYIDGNSLSSDLGLRQIEDAINHGLFVKAVEMLKEAIAAEPTNPNVYLLFTKAYQRMGDAENASKFSAIYNALIARQ